MRISNTDIINIFQVFSAALPNCELNVYLYGSRVDDSKRGGDIDLLWLVAENQEQQLNINKHKILAALKGFMGEQKIDLSIISQHTLTTEIFYSHAMATAVKLK